MAPPRPGPSRPAPSAGTDAAAADARTVPASLASSSDRASKPLWARLDSPFGVGFLLTLGGLAALAARHRADNIATVIIYIALAMFAALGLDPVLKWFERHNVKRPWAITIVFLIFGVLGAGLIWLVVPTLIEQVSFVHHRHPGHDRQLRDHRHLRVAGGHLRTRA